MQVIYLVIGTQYNTVRFIIVIIIFCSLYSPTFLSAPKGISFGLLVCPFLGIFSPQLKSPFYFLFIFLFHLTIRVLFVANSNNDLAALEVLLFRKC